MMDRKGGHRFPQGTQVVIYENDTFLQYVNENVITEALTQHELLCLYTGLEINVAETEFNPGS